MSDQKAKYLIALPLRKLRSQETQLDRMSKTHPLADLTTMNLNRSKRLVACSSSRPPGNPSVITTNNFSFLAQNFEQ